jgi:hypothetical protein
MRAMLNGKTTGPRAPRSSRPWPSWKATVANFFAARALFVGKLKGKAPVRFIYVDEAGISAPEPVTVVVGVIVHADKHWRAAESRINNQILDAFVPPSQRANFIFHAKEVYSGGKQVDRNTWGFRQRLEFIKAMAAVPRQFQMAVSLGMVRRESNAASEEDLKRLNLSKEQWQHMFAFGFCIGRADKYLRDHVASDEVATIVAEDAPDMRQFLRRALDILRKHPITLPTAMLNPTKKEKELGVITQQPEQFVSRIVDNVHFAEKKFAFLLQLADACAFSFRRCFAEQEHGKDLVACILGKTLEFEDYKGPSNGDLFYWHKELWQRKSMVY